MGAVEGDLGADLTVKLVRRSGSYTNCIEKCSIPVSPPLNEYNGTDVSRSSLKGEMTCTNPKGQHSSWPYISLPATTVPKVSNTCGRLRRSPRAATPGPRPLPC